MLPQDMVWTAWQTFSDPEYGINSITPLRTKSQALSIVSLYNERCMLLYTQPKRIIPGRWGHMQYAFTCPGLRACRSTQRGAEMENRMSELENLAETKYRNIAGIKVVKKGQCMYETYFNGFGPEDTIHVMSVTKSILSALTGIAIDRGDIQSADQKVLDFFPDYTPKRGEKTIQKVTLKNLLTMTAPYKYRSEPYTKVYTSADWTRAALDLLGGRAGITGAFQYSTVGIQILSGILANATGMPVRDFAAEYLFTPLGIKTPDNTILHNKKEHFEFLKERHPSGWVVDPKGVNTAGWGLCLTLCDMVKFGELYAKEGLFHSKRILSSSWIRESTGEKSRWGELPYGYLWWIIDYRGSHCYAAIGDGGNAVFVCPEKELVAAVASCFVQRAEIPILELLTGRIVPMFV